MSEKEKSAAELLREKLVYKTKNGFNTMSDAELEAANAYCEGYKEYLDASKTEREAVTAAVAMLEAKGFVPFVAGMAFHIYYICRCAYYDARRCVGSGQSERSASFVGIGYSVCVFHCHH